jgi:peptidoglycan/xylan/chitin deacetylase (PgdA/CDA1 family)
LTRDEVIHKYDGMVPSSWGPDAAGTIESLGTSDPVVALTFDACGGPTPRSAGCGFDRTLIDLLRRYEARATLFLNARWIAANPAVADELVHDPLFEIGNHGTRHRPLSVNGRSAYGERGTRSVAEAYDEVAGNHEILTGLLGHPPRFFRSGTACCDDVAVRIAGELGERIVSFTVNGDAGTTFTAPQVAAALRTVRRGDIVISHVNRPTHQTARGYALGLPRLIERGLRTVTLSEYLTA